MKAWLFHGIGEELELIERPDPVPGPGQVVIDVRGAGLFLGVELVRDRTTLDPATDEAGRIVNHLRQCGILASTDGPLDNVLKFKPPMVFGMAEADRLLTETEKALTLLAQGKLP